MTQSTLLAVGLAAPTPVTFTTATTGGTLPSSTTYYYRVSTLTATGESLPNTETSKATGAGTETNTITVKWSAVTGATGYKVYGRSTGAELLMATISSQATVQWVDDGSVTPAGAMPTVQTAGKSPRTSSDAVVVAGKPVTIGIFTDDTGGLPANEGVTVFQDTPGLDLAVFSLTGSHPTRVITGSGTFRAASDTSTVNIGVFLEQDA